jgi:hypothetical protein
MSRHPNQGQESSFVEVPVMDKFGGEVIGNLSIQKDKLPTHPTFCFALGYRADRMLTVGGQVPTNTYEGPYELMCVAVVSDENYQQLLLQLRVGQ